MRTEEEIRRRAITSLKSSFQHSDAGHQIMAERCDARHDALCWVLGLDADEADELWEEAQKEYEQGKRNRERPTTL